MSDRWSQARSALRPHPEFAGEPDRDYSLEERMRLHNVPAVSIAVIDDGQIAVDTGVGQLAADDPTAATADTVFAACSISKAVSATAALRLVAAGKLPLDGDVNQHLRDWRLTDAQGRPVNVTLRQILTHTAGINIHGADGYDPAGPVPTLEQVFRGETPCMSPRIHVVTQPGSRYEYSSGGYTVVGKLICDATGQSFDDAMAALVFGPLAMRHSTFDSEGARARHLRRAAAHVSLIRKASAETRLVWPAQAPAGLWTTAGDLVRLVLALQKAYDGSGDFLPHELACETLRRQTPHHDIGLGLYLLGQDGTPARRFSHTGGYLGYKAEMLGWFAGGHGAVVMVNNGYTGAALKSEIIAALQRSYGWAA
jgi:CubicO group peptidase (beta-lactamase class C family)